MPYEDDVSDTAATSLLNGHSLSRLTGASVHTKTTIEVRMPASSLAEALAEINRLGRSGKMEINFQRGRALDIKFLTSRRVATDDV